MDRTTDTGPSTDLRGSASTPLALQPDLQLARAASAVQCIRCTLALRRPSSRESRPPPGHALIPGSASPPHSAIRKAIRHSAECCASFALGRVLVRVSSSQRLRTVVDGAASAPAPAAALVDAWNALANVMMQRPCWCHLDGRGLASSAAEASLSDAATYSPLPSALYRVRCRPCDVDAAILKVSQRP